MFHCWPDRVIHLHVRLDEAQPAQPPDQRPGLQFAEAGNGFTEHLRSSAQHECAALFCTLCHFIEKACLADAWFTADKHDVSVTGRAGLKEVPQLVQFFMPTRQR